MTKKPTKATKSTKATKTAKPAKAVPAVVARRGRKAPKMTEFKLKPEPLPVWREAKASLEQWMLTEALRRSGGNMAAAGRLLGITKVAVLHAVRRHGLEELTHAG
jgi:transcriptional regulator with GAF, ATPase, and Fis domain